MKSKTKLREKLDALNERIVGTDGNENLRGHKGDDSIVGAKGDDRIKGGAGDDYLSGNQGNDVLKGGRGADIFVFDGDFDRDVVKDFSACDGDRFEFVLYDPAQADWTGQTLLDLCVARGKDVVLEMPGTDDAVVLQKVDLSDLSADHFDVFFYQNSFDFAA